MRGEKKKRSKITLRIPAWVTRWLVMAMHGVWSLVLKIFSLLYLQDIPVEAGKSYETPVGSSRDQRQVRARTMNLGVLTYCYLLREVDPASAGRVNHFLLTLLKLLVQYVSHCVVSTCFMYPFLYQTTGW